MFFKAWRPGWAPCFFYLLPSAIIFLVVFLGYSDTFNYPFHFDDGAAIEENRDIRDITNVERIWSRNPARFLVFFSLAVNYHFGELNVFGYHLFNVLVHFINALLVFWLIKTLTITRFGVTSIARPEKIESSIKYLKLYPYFVAIFFAAHPLQTEAVTYIWQRNSSMVAVFYLLSLVLYLKSSMVSELEKTKVISRLYLIGSVTAAVAAMFTKQNAITLPIAIVLAEYFFISGSFAKMRPKILSLAWFIPPMMIVPALTMFGMNNEINHIGARAQNILPVYEYLLTQFNVVVTYLKLLVFPVNLNLDYDFPSAASFADSWHSFVILILILLSGVLLFNRNRLASFGVIFFFLALSVESSFFPLEDLIFEHRAYLPSVGFFMAVGAITFNMAQSIPYAGVFRAMVAALVILTIVMTVATRARNHVWKDKVTLWKDVVKKSPGKSRGFNILGATFYKQGQLGEAEKWFKKAFEIDPESNYAIFNLGIIYDKSGKTEKALKYFHLAEKNNPAAAMIHYALGNIYLRDKVYPNAIKHYMIASKVDREQNVEGLLALGTALTLGGRVDIAIETYEKALKVEPDNATALGNLKALHLHKSGKEKADRE